MLQRNSTGREIRRPRPQESQTLGLSRSKGSAFQSGILHSATTDIGQNEGLVGLQIRAPFIRKLLKKILPPAPSTEKKTRNPNQERQKGRLQDDGEGDLEGSWALGLAAATLTGAEHGDGRGDAKKR